MSATSTSGLGDTAEPAPAEPRGQRAEEPQHVAADSSENRVTAATALASGQRSGADPPPSIAGTECALARATVLPSLTPTTAPLRATPDPHLSATTRRRHARIELVLIVRRAERGPPRVMRPAPADARRRAG
jgi:hypothetical protein